MGTAEAGPFGTVIGCAVTGRARQPKAVAPTRRGGGRNFRRLERRFPKRPFEFNPLAEQLNVPTQELGSGLVTGFETPANQLAGARIIELQPPDLSSEISRRDGVSVSKRLPQIPRGS